MPGLVPEILDAVCLLGAAAWPVLGLVVGLLVLRLRYERSRRAAVGRELRERESRYRAIFETAVDAIIVSDQHGIIQEFSRAAEAMTGYRAAELIGQNMRVLLPPAMRQEPERYTARYLWTIKELEVCRKDGSVFPAHLSIAEWWAGGYRHFTGILRDLSAQHREQIERTKLEAQLHQAQKMEAIGNLTGGMAHDFNNMLGVIIGNIDLLRDLKGEDSDIDELTREALDAAFRGADLTRRLLAFARQQPLRPQHVDVNELVSGITRLLRRTIGEDVEISLDLAPELWPVVVDPAQLEASLTNLATNARDAMADGGRLMIVTGNHTRRRLCRTARRGRTGRLRHARSQRYRVRHDLGGHASDFRTILHDQEPGQGHRPRPQHGVRLHQAIGRTYRRLQRARNWHDVPPFPAAHDRGCAGRRGERRNSATARQRRVGLGG